MPIVDFACRVRAGRALRRLLAAIVLPALSSCAQVAQYTPPPVAPAAAPAPTPAAAPASEAAPTPLQPAPAPLPPVAAAAAAPAPRTVALLLPAAASPFARAGEAVRQGFFAAQAASGQSMTVQVIEVDDDPRKLAGALQAAQQRGAQVIAGPLTRAQVGVLLKAEVPLPLVTLSLPEADAGASPAVLGFGLSIEQEARVTVQAAVRTLVPVAPGAQTRLTPRFVLLTGEGALARRAGAAFRDALREAGERVTVFNVVAKYDALQALGDRVFRAEPDAVFLALDAREAAMVRPRLPHDVPMFATSQVNLGGGEAALLAPDLEGVRFVDAPWLLEPDHAAVMVYPRPDVPLSAELNRLYALGIDAYRLCVEWGAGRTSFELDGVTGSLRVDRAAGLRVERWPAFALFRNGRVERLAVPRPAP